jgi:AcrR family transcriptional regulator
MIAGTMAEVRWQRARDDEQRHERRQAILDIASELIAREAFPAINMAEVARRAGLAKGTLYLYFPTKEALFLTLTEATLDAWFARVEREIGARATRAEVVRLLTAAIAQTPLLPRLLGILHTVLEHNIGDAHVLTFKRFLRARVLRIGARLDNALRWPSGSGTAALVRLHAVIIGLQHMASPSAAVRRALKHDDLAIFRMDFAQSLADMLPLILRPR